MAQGDYSTGWEEGWLAQQERNEKILQEARSVLGSDDLGPLYQTEPQSPAARVIPSWLPLAAYGTGLALGESKPLSGIGDMLASCVGPVGAKGCTVGT